MKTRRVDKDKQVRKRVLVLCEGAKTEPNYFRSMRHDLQLRHRLTAVEVDIYQPKSYSPLGLFREALARKKQEMARKNPYDAIWIVFDRDFHQQVGWVIDTATEHEIHCIVSNICFEVWFLLHYQNLVASEPFEKCDAVIRFIHRHYDEYYHKNDNHYEQLKGLLPQALLRAKELERDYRQGPYHRRPFYEWNPYTNVYQLVEYLLGL